MLNAAFTVQCSLFTVHCSGVQRAGPPKWKSQDGVPYVLCTHVHAKAWLPQGTATGKPGLKATQLGISIKEFMGRPPKYLALKTVLGSNQTVANDIFADAALHGMCIGVLFAYVCPSFWGPTWSIGQQEV